MSTPLKFRPMRTGAPPSSRNFNQSSAGGAGMYDANQIDLGSLKLENDAADAADALESERKAKQAAWPKTYLYNEETLCNDYSTHYVKTGLRPQDYLRGTDVTHRFKEYPRLAKLIESKHAQMDSPAVSVPPLFHLLESGEGGRTNMLSVISSDLAGCVFDSILISPPPEVTYDELMTLDVPKVASTPGFIWLWVGTGQRGNGIGLEQGRELLSLWGYRRCEDIVWLKTNGGEPEEGLNEPCETLLKPTLEHCLMGIRGTVRRSTDAWFVHCNVDTDVMVWGGDKDDKNLKPPELQTLIETFCQGTRRLHLYGSPKSLRRGWLTVGKEFDLSALQNVESETTLWTPQKFVREPYLHTVKNNIPLTLPFSEDIDSLRPKSPPTRKGVPSSGGLGRGRGAGLGVTRSQTANYSNYNNYNNGYGNRLGRGGGYRDSPHNRSGPNHNLLYQQQLAMQQQQQQQYQQYQMMMAQAQYYQRYGSEGAPMYMYDPSQLPYSMPGGMPYMGSPSGTYPLGPASGGYPVVSSAGGYPTMASSPGYPMQHYQGPFYTDGPAAAPNARRPSGGNVNSNFGRPGNRRPENSQPNNRR